MVEQFSENCTKNRFHQLNDLQIPMEPIEMSCEPIEMQLEFDAVRFQAVYIKIIQYINKIFKKKKKLSLKHKLNLFYKNSCFLLAFQSTKIHSFCNFKSIA